MTLSILSVDALKIILDHVEIDDKSSLLMTGHKALIAKLSQVETNIAVLPYDRVEVESFTEDEDGFHITMRNFSCIAMSKSYRLADKHSVYGLLPFYYKNAKSAAVHSVHLERAVAMLPKVKVLTVYLKNGFSQFLQLASSTLTDLRLIMHGNCDIGTLFQNLPKTLLVLYLRYKRNQFTAISAYQALMLPRDLEMLSGCGINYDAVVDALPRSLTVIECKDLDKVSPSSFPPNLTEITADCVDVASLSHLPLRYLKCSISRTSNISFLSLHSLTQLHCFIACESVQSWDNPVRFPQSLTNLYLDADLPVCCLVPSSVTKLRMGRRYNVFETSTSTWSFCGNRLFDNIPANVVHAHVRTYNSSDEELDKLFAKVQNVETLVMNTPGRAPYIQSFHTFTKCTKLILPQRINVRSLPPLIVHLNIYHTWIDGIVWPKTLQHVVVLDALFLHDVEAMSPLYLECEGNMILSHKKYVDDTEVVDFDCISHIPEVVLHVPLAMRGDLPVLPANAKYKFY